ncbi:alpha/beta hydrolase-fold protein [Cupriavidus sp. 30B13]|uniref:alpha/beta hydrolase-fold protein n=1 Tax=Cupriavidus sp. 30B13 TaxID=3384241 RepID=UPI003B90B246
MAPARANEAGADGARAVAAPPGRIAGGASVAGSLRPGEAATYKIALARGDLVQGGFEGMPATLDLLDAGGGHLRRLAGATLPTRDFLFVAPADGDYLLAVRAPAQDDAPGALRFRLALGATVPPSAQHAPPEALESPRLRALAAGGDAGDVAAFWREMAARGTPLVEPADADGAGMLVTFLWRGARGNVRLFGSPAGDHDALARLGDSDVWFRSYRLPATTRLSYQLAPDVPELDAPAPQRRRAILATSQRDPLNPRVFAAGDAADAADAADVFGQKSVLELPGAPPQPWLAPRPAVPAGTLRRHRFDSRLLGNTRDVYLYRPAGYRPGAAGQALLVVFDAQAYVSLVPTPAILDNLIAEGRIPPTAAVIVGNPSANARSAELPPNPLFARFLAEELMPWARAQGVAAPAARTVIAGSSYGGLASAYAALRHPGLFGNVLSQSGSFWWAPGAGSALAAGTGAGENESEPEWLARRYAEAGRLPLRFYLEAGLFEGARGPGGILSATRHLRDVLRARGYPVRYAESASGHDYLHWRGSLACGLMALIGTPPAPATEAARACPMLKD